MLQFAAPKGFSRSVDRNDPSTPSPGTIIMERCEMMKITDRKIFQILPGGFFNLLAGGSNQEIYSECLLLIYEQFEREISYRGDRKQIRDVLASFLYDQNVSLDLEEETQKNYSDLANAIIRKMASKNGPRGRSQGTIFSEMSC